MRCRALGLLLCGVVGLPLGAQQPRWGDSTTLALVDRAIARRGVQLADTGLVDYAARAHGFLTFLAQVGDGFPDPPKVVRTDELQVEVQWRAPDRSRQTIVGRRDTLLLPTDINYHRDHLAIIQNNFPAIIRLGDGDEVRDVPHPLSPAGRAFYEFAIADSFALRTNDRAIDVIELRVRPRDDRLPAAVGALYVDRDQASVVRMAFSFTRAALRDRQLEDVSVVLENGLVDGRHWLPRRQEIEIRRSGTWLDFPARGIIRGRWEICCARTNVGLDQSLFAGPEVVQLPPDVTRRYPFAGTILEALPLDQQRAGADDVRRVQEEARALVRATALRRAERPVPSARALSELVRVNRVEGLALGAGFSRRFGDGFSGGALLRGGFGDRRFKGELRAAWEHRAGLGFGLAARDEVAFAGDVPEVSGVRNTIAAQEFGADLTSPFRQRALTARVALAPGSAMRPWLAAELAHESPLVAVGRPARGSFRPAPPADPLQAARLTLGWRAGAGTPIPGTIAWSLEGRLQAQRSRFEQDGAVGWLGRAMLDARFDRPLGLGRLVTRSVASGLTAGRVPWQALALAGGPITAPGHGFHALQGRRLVSQRVEWRVPVRALPALPLGRFGRMPSTLTVAPFAHLTWVDGVASGRGGWHPAVGVGTLGLFDLLRVDVARGWRGGRWRVAVDVSDALWRVL